VRLCEIGAGFGRLADLYRGYECAVLLDFSHSMLAEARARLEGDPRFLFVAADLYSLPLADSALDTAVTVRVLHHVADIPRAFSEIARVVRPHGAYVLEHANKRHLKALFRYALTRRGPNPTGREPYEFVKLNFDFHPAYIQAHLRSVGLALREERAVSTFRLPLLKRALPAQLLAGLDGLIQRPTARLHLSPSLFIRAESAKPGAPSLNPVLWRCVNCGSLDLAESTGALICRACHSTFPVVDGIIDFRPRNQT
jgi:SAM-dependent methyltransferase